MQARVAVVGLGNIGCAVAAEIAASESFELVAGVDIDPALAGRDVGEVCGADRTGIEVRSDIASTLADTHPDAVLIATGSRLESVAPIVELAVDAGVNVISSCEELVWPRQTNPELAGDISDRATQAGVSVLGVGVNPGFIQDLLVVVAGGATRNIKSVQGIRKVDLSQRRLPLQLKMGVGLDPDSFAEERSGGNLGHIGLEQSLGVVAAGLEIEIDSVSVDEGPLIAEDDIRAGSALVGKGLVRGMWMRASGEAGGEERVVLDLEMGIGTKTEDRILIDGEPPISMVFEGGVQGDDATVARIVNVIEQVIEAPPGLLSVLDLPPVPTTRSAG